MKTILFYVKMDDPSLFYTQRFYVNTKSLLEDLGYNVIVSHSVKDAWRKEYDGLFVFFYKRGVVPGIIAKALGKKVFFYGGIDDLNLQTTSLFRYICTCIVVKSCILVGDWCLVESKSDLANIQKISLRKIHKNVYLSPQAIDVEKYNCNIMDKQMCFSTVAHLTKHNLMRKGVDISLYYFKCLIEHPRYKDSRYYIMGRPASGKSYLEGIVNELGLGEKVIITGEIDEDKKIEILKKSKYYFQLSHYEGFGLAALEALAAKCRVFSSDNGGLHDTVGSDGIIININNFDYSIDSVDNSFIERMDELTDEYVEKTYVRIKETYDIPIRKRNFFNTICKSLPAE